MIHILLGVIIGFLAGLIPGVHINSILPFIFFFSSNELVVSASIAFVFSNIFPAVLIGADDVSTLPGHRLMRRGKSFTAIMLSLNSTLIAVPAACIAFFLFLPFLEKFFSYFPYFTIATLVLVLILFSRKPASLFITVLCACLGLLTFNLNMLLPLLTGFFALSTIIRSLKSKPVKQSLDYEPTISNVEFLRAAGLSVLLSGFMALVPAVSSSITAAISRALGDLDAEQFIVFTSAADAVYMISSIYFFLFFGKMRSGTAAYLNIDFSVYAAAGVILLSAALAYLLCSYFSKKIVLFFQRINYFKINLAALAFLVCVNFIFTGPLGLVVLAVSTSIGLLCRELGVKRINCMSALIVPTVLVLL